MIRDSIYLAALLTAAAACGVAAARTSAAAMRWAIGRAIVNTLG
jgi:hypothetical protein